MKLPHLNTANEWKTGTVFVVTGIFIGLLLTIQFRSSIPSTSYFYDELQAQKELIESYISDQALLKAKLVTVREEIDAEQEKSRTSGQEGVLDSLRALKNEVGLEKVIGKGVVIQFDDGVFVDRESADKMAESLVHASDLRDLVNILRTAKIQAIAINDQRIIASTPITSVGNTILVNNFHLLPPFTITAIGDPELIMQRLNDPAALPDIQKRANELKIRFSSSVQEGLAAPVYNGNLTLKYIRELSDPA